MTEMAEETKAHEQTEESRCKYEDCNRPAEHDSEYCIFHMPAEEKEEKRLWEKCMKRFYGLVDAGEGDFKGSVLKDVNLAARVLEQEIDFGWAKFSGWASFVAAKFTEKANFSGAEFTEKANFSGA
ncbi:MAG: pentapeptide repeat-containing protein, partial [Thermoplasmata archaeon]|nr:pentapeptide repeat-containing protein [Thermoplasmata archaeon]